MSLGWIFEKKWFSVVETKSLEKYLMMTEMIRQPWSHL